MEQDKQQKQQNLIDISQGMTLVLIAIFSVNRSVQIWSRCLGSTGSWFYGWMFFVGLLLQAWYCQLNAHATSRADVISFETIAYVSVFWFAIHGVVRSFHFARGIRFHTYEPGYGVLQGMLPTLSVGSTALASDLTVAVGLSLLCWLIGSPILSGWYASICFWLIVGHLWINMSQSRRLQMWFDSQVESNRWSQQTKE